MFIKWVGIPFYAESPLTRNELMSVLQIDTSNITNAFVSGMKEDLNLYKNEYNYIVIAWTVGYVIGQWPSNFILTRVRAHSLSFDSSKDSQLILSSMDTDPGTRMDNFHFCSGRCKVVSSGPHSSILRRTIRSWVLAFTLLSSRKLV